MAQRYGSAAPVLHGGDSEPSPWSTSTAPPGNRVLVVPFIAVASISDKCGQYELISQPSRSNRYPRHSAARRSCLVASNSTYAIVTSSPGLRSLVARSVMRRPLKDCAADGESAWFTIAAAGYTATPTGFNSSSHTVCALHDILPSNRAMSRGSGPVAVSSMDAPAAPFRVPAKKAEVSVAACASCALRASGRASQLASRASRASNPSPRPSAVAAFTPSSSISSSSPVDPPSRDRPSRARRQRMRAASRTVGGGTRGAHFTSDAHSSLYPRFHAAACASREP